MSEMLSPAPADAVQAVPVAPDQAVSSATETPEAGAEAPVTQEDVEPPRDPATGRFAKRTEQLNRQIGDLTATKHTLQRQVEMLSERAMSLRKQIEQPPQIDPADFDGQQRHAVAQAVKQDRYEQTVEEARQLQAMQAQTMAAMFNAKVEAARERIPDLDQSLATFSNIPISDYACEVLAESEKAPEIAHWLAKNPQEARRIVALPPARQGVEIARIESRLSSNPIKRISQAPPPPQTVAGGSTAGGVDLNTADMATYIKARMG